MISIIHAINDALVLSAIILSNSVGPYLGSLRKSRAGSSDRKSVERPGNTEARGRAVRFADCLELCPREREKGAL